MSAQADIWPQAHQQRNSFRCVLADADAAGTLPAHDEMNAMQITRRQIDIADWLWFFAWGIFSTVWCLTASRHLSGTVDEWIYVERGLRCWRMFSHQGLLLLGTMPLPVDVETLPLFLWERLGHARFDPFTDLATPLYWARMGTLVFWWLLLIYARLIGRKLGGAWAGRLAVGLLACEPNLLAHATLATTDISVSACLLAFTYHFQDGRGKDWKRRVALPTLWFAALVLCKASGLVFGILCMLAIQGREKGKGKREKEEEKKRRKEEEKTQSSIDNQQSAMSNPNTQHQSLWKDMSWIVGVGTLLVFVYCGTDWLPYAGLARRAHALPIGTKRTLFVWLADHLRLYANAADGVVRQVQHNSHGQGWFLLGHSGPHYVWWYFPVVLTVKLSLPLLLLPVVIAVCRRGCLLNWACLCALIQFALSITYHVQIGVRFLFPAICMGIVGLSASAVCAEKEPHPQPLSLPRNALGEGSLLQQQGESHTPKAVSLQRTRERLPIIVACLGLVWTTFTAVLWWPNGLAYTNGLWGDSRKGYLLVSDSNYDWGQGLLELRQWQQAHPDKPLCLWYFGYDPAHTIFTDIPQEALTARGVQEVRTALRGKYLAASATQVYGGYNDTKQPLVACLREMQPTAQTTTFLIYDFTRVKQ